MIFCENCFNDKEIISIICSVPLLNTGKCPLCHNEGHLYNTDTQNFLTPYFEELLNIYAPSTTLPETYPRAKVRSLIDDLKDRWNIFAEIPREQIYEILKSICGELYANVPELFNGAVGIPELYDSVYLREHALLKNNNWDAFVEEIKTKNRFHSKLINFDILEKYCSFIRKPYKKGKLFYRARISDRSGYPKSEMSAPPAGKSLEGRANARGIVCLYVASDVDTTLHEVRAGVFDFVSVGTFQLKKDITVVDLRAIAEISPFVEGLDYLDHAINKQYLEKLNIEMSKSLRRSDSTLDYVPTQYIVDFIKSITHNGKQEYDGIEYNSTTNPGGYNLSIFNPDVFECMAVDAYDIEQLHYTFTRVNR